MKVVIILLSPVYHVQKVMLGCLVSFDSILSDIGHFFMYTSNEGSMAGRFYKYSFYVSYRFKYVCPQQSLISLQLVLQWKIEHLNHPILDVSMNIKDHSNVKFWMIKQEQKIRLIYSAYMYVTESKLHLFFKEDLLLVQLLFQASSSCFFLPKDQFEVLKEVAEKKMLIHLTP